MGHLGMVIYLPYFQFVSPPIGGLTLGPIFMCVLLCLCFLAAYKYDIHRDAQLDFSGTAQNDRNVACSRQLLFFPTCLVDLDRAGGTLLPMKAWISFNLIPSHNFVFGCDVIISSDLLIIDMH